MCLSLRATIARSLVALTIAAPVSAQTATERLKSLFEQQWENHPYRDGNKRIAFLAMAVLVGLNGFEIEAEESDVVSVMVAAARHRLTERQLSRWIAEHLVRIS